MTIINSLIRPLIFLMFFEGVFFTPAHADAPIPYSDFQRGFMVVVRDYAIKYKAAENELQKSALINERVTAFQKLKGSPRQIKGWFGVLEKMGTTHDGRAFVSISLAPNLISVSTWNNALSDASDKTLIPQTSPLYSKLASMKIGNVVKFSGRLKYPTNFLEEGKMTTPNFLFVFTDIEKVGDKATP